MRNTRTRPEPTDTTGIPTLRIVSLYAQLLTLRSSPVVALNCGVVAETLRWITSPEHSDWPAVQRNIVTSLGKWKSAALA